MKGGSQLEQQILKNHIKPKLIEKGNRLPPPREYFALEAP
jgi:hypothetical protein